MREADVEGGRVDGLEITLEEGMMMERLAERARVGRSDEMRLVSRMIDCTNRLVNGLFCCRTSRLGGR